MYVCMYVCMYVSTTIYNVTCSEGRVWHLKHNTSSLCANSTFKYLQDDIQCTYIRWDMSVSASWKARQLDECKGFMASNNEASCFYSSLIWCIDERTDWFGNSHM